MKDVSVIYERIGNTNAGALFDKDDVESLRDKGFKTEQIKKFGVFIAAAYHELKVAP